MEFEPALGLGDGLGDFCISIMELKCNLSTFKARIEHRSLYKDRLRLFLVQSVLRHLMCSKCYTSQTKAGDSSSRVIRSIPLPQGRISSC